MASMIGKIYFNSLGSKCFRLTKFDVCMEYTLPGRCKRYQMTATLINQASYLQNDRRVEAASITASI
ncbi:hypothetical protein MAR_008063 [Mya arenaria]|uniref:Uncharacterized protein n=2 Tax=Mya arenaria TaxID=6604 RepID=A0ABY7DUV8_MYAAR|nr:hypothetical protein MAR_008063 [Mya arenaria]